MRNQYFQAENLPKFLWFRKLLKHSSLLPCPPYTLNILYSEQCNTLNLAIINSHLSCWEHQNYFINPWSVPLGIWRTIVLWLRSKNFRSILTDWITPNPIVADSWRPSTGSWALAIRPIYRHGHPRYRSAPSVRRTFSRICSWCTRASRNTVSKTSSPTRSSLPSGWV